MATAGYTTIGGTAYSPAANEAIHERFSVPIGAKITEIQIYAQTVAGVGSIRGALYSDVGVAPSSLLATSVNDNMTTTPAWNICPIFYAVPTTANLWFVACSDVAWTIYYDASVGQEAGSKTSWTYAAPANPYGAETTSLDGNVASIYVTYTLSPAIDTQPTSQSAAVGATATFTAAATTSGGALSAQWKSSVDGETFSNIGGETSTTTYTTAALTSDDNGKYIKCTYTDSNGSYDTLVARLWVKNLAITGKGRKL